MFGEQTALQLVDLLTGPGTPEPTRVVQVQPGDVEIPIGRDIEVKSLFTGRIPREAEFSGPGQSMTEMRPEVGDPQGPRVTP